MYRYSVRVLKSLAETYLYWQGYEEKPASSRETNQYSISEYLADFELGLSRLAGKKFVFNGLDFKNYINYNRYCRLIIADIIGITDSELVDKYHFYDLIRLREISYSMLKRVLNE
jgi:hypothetical protein